MPRTSRYDPPWEYVMALGVLAFAIIVSGTKKAVKEIRERRRKGLPKAKTKKKKKP